MKREIKFRAWVTGSNIMADWDTIYQNDREGISTLMDYITAPDCIVMQFTGLKDKNGVEIYEGDVVHFILDNPENLSQTFIEEVRYQGSGFCVDGQCPVDATTDWEVEVIGNIYQNPELLKP